RHNEVRVTHRHAQAHREMSVTVDNPQTESRDPLILDKFVSRNTEPPLPMDKCTHPWISVPTHG
ncbi:MAG: hypothetical protein QGI68_04060, partial [Pseudomonadales bacterium]|nr:hypothetical protein [Pseudomonadales bacterium]